MSPQSLDVSTILISSFKSDACKRKEWAPTPYTTTTATTHSLRTHQIVYVCVCCPRCTECSRYGGFFF
jgi:hypothetical protein